MIPAGHVFKVVITDGSFEEPDIEKEVFSRIGATVEKRPAKTADELRAVAEDADAVLTGSSQFSKEVIGALGRTKVIVSLGIGYDHIDVKAAREKGIVVSNTPDFMTYEVAEHTMALILALTRRIPQSDAFVRRGEWARFGGLSWKRLMPLTNMDGKMLGIIGWGRIGQQVGDLGKAFHMDVIAYAPRGSKELAQQRGVELVELPELMKRSDIISINARLSDETYHMIGEKELALMKSTAYLINTGRGRIIDQKALYRALSSGRIAGAGLDVLEKEPPDLDDPILKLESVIYTPHVAGVSQKSMVAYRRLAAQEAMRVLLGEPPKHRVN